MTEKFIPDNSDLLAREIACGKILSATIRCAPDAEFEKIRIRQILLKNEKAYQAEQFRDPKVFHRNIESTSLAAELSRIFKQGITNAEFTLESGETRTISVLSNRRGEIRVIRKHMPKNGLEEKADAPPRHNREKQYILEEGIAVPFLVDLGVMDKNGAVIKAKYDKFRQVNRFLEFIQDVVPELESAAADNQDGTARELSIVDFGCGKSYLTFAVYYYLSEIKKLPVRIIGLDLKEDVIEECALLAERYGYRKLHFAVGNIADYTGCDRADMVITLHACDTATDHALAQAVRWNARVILSVPCCQHELNAQLAEARTDPPEEPIPDGRKILSTAFRHGIIRERMAALLTDAMRAELLENAGYAVQILEFIDMSHTPKNLLIRAVLPDRAKPPHDAKDYETLRDFLGVRPELERILRKENKE